MENRPFLFLDSPRVGNRGHCYVVAQGEAVPPESTLSYLAEQARDRRLNGEGIISARHRVQQVTRGMPREGDELLICGGAIPANPENTKVVQQVLGDLLQFLPQGQLSTDAQVSSFVHEARFMKDVAMRFRSDRRVEGMNWKSIGTIRKNEKAPIQNSSGRPTLRGRLRHLSLLMKLTLLLILVGSICIVAKVANRNTDPEAPGRAVVEDGGALEKWALFTKDYWPRLMKATGAPNLSADVAGLLTASQKKPDSRLKELFDPAKEEPGRVRVSAQDIARADAQMVKWAKQFNEEFELPANGVFQSNPAIEALAQAKGAAGIEAAAWFRDTMNQRTKYPSELQSKAKILENFAKAFPDMPAGELPSRLRKLFVVLDTFSRSPAAGGDAVKPFRDVMNNALLNVTPPPPEYEVLTPKDAHRIEALQRVLGSGEFGLIAVRAQFKAERHDWTEIKETVGFGMAAAEKGLIVGAAAKLLQELQQAFTSPSKQAKPH